MNSHTRSSSVNSDEWTPGDALGQKPCDTHRCKSQSAVSSQQLLELLFFGVVSLRVAMRAVIRVMYQWTTLQETGKEEEEMRQGQ